MKQKQYEIPDLPEPNPDWKMREEMPLKTYQNRLLVGVYSTIVLVIGLIALFDYFGAG